MAGDTEYKVLPNDCLSKIAKQHGFTWKKLWDYGPNAALKQKRKDPNILMPGDILRIPAIAKKHESRAVNNCHRFVRRKEQATLSIRVMVDGEPVKDTPCRLRIEMLGNSAEKHGSTDHQGHVKINGTREIKLPGETRSAVLLVGAPPHEITYPLAIGHLAPYDELLGVQQRLNNLGYHCGPEDGLLGHRTKAAITAFQQKTNLTSNGMPDSKTKEELKKAHGC